MSNSDVLLFVGATTLVAAIVTLFVFQMTAAKLERTIDRRSRTLEGPVPGRRALSTIGLNTESPQRTTPSSRPFSRQPATHVDNSQEMGLSTLPAPLAPSSTKEDKLNSLQTIRARSAALNTDAQPEQSAEPKPMTPAGTPHVQRLPKRPTSDLEQEQGPATVHAKSRSEKAGGIDNLSPSSAETAEPTIAPKTTTSKRAKRANAQADRTGTSRRGLDQSSPDALADSPSLDLLDALQASETGGSFNRDSALPDIFAGLSNAEAGIQGLTDDLSDIDGGGLPTAAPKTPQKSRR